MINDIPEERNSIEKANIKTTKTILNTLKTIKRLKEQLIQTLLQLQHIYSILFLLQNILIQQTTLRKLIMHILPHHYQSNTQLSPQVCLSKWMLPFCMLAVWCTLCRASFGVVESHILSSILNLHILLESFLSLF